MITSRVAHSVPFPCCLWNTHKECEVSLSVTSIWQLEQVVNMSSTDSAEFVCFFFFSFSSYLIWFVQLNCSTNFHSNRKGKTWIWTVKMYGFSFIIWWNWRNQLNWLIFTSLNDGKQNQMPFTLNTFHNFCFNSLFKEKLFHFDPLILICRSTTSLLSPSKYQILWIGLNDEWHFHLISLAFANSSVFSNIPKSTKGFRSFRRPYPSIHFKYFVMSLLEWDIEDDSYRNGDCKNENKVSAIRWI